MFRGIVSHELMGKSGKVEVDIEFSPEVITGVAAFTAKDTVSGWSFKIKADISGKCDVTSGEFEFQSAPKEIKYAGESHVVCLVGKGNAIVKDNGRRDLLKVTVYFYSNRVCKGSEIVSFELVQ